MTNIIVSDFMEKQITQWAERLRDDDDDLLDIKGYLDIGSPPCCIVGEFHNFEDSYFLCEEDENNYEYCPQCHEFGNSFFDFIEDSEIMEILLEKFEDHIKKDHKHLIKGLTV